MTQTEIADSLSTLNRLQAVGEAGAVSRIVSRLLDLYPSQGERSDSVVEDWVRKLQAYPIASIWAAYDRLIEQPGKFAPSLGDFIVKVKTHANTVSNIKLSIMEGQGT